jgi:hypothetical protein
MSLMQCLAFTSLRCNADCDQGRPCRQFCKRLPACSTVAAEMESQSRAAGALTTTFYTNIFGLEAAAANAARLDHDLRRRRAAYFT